MRRMLPRQADEIADIESQDAAAASSSLHQLSLIIGTQRDPPVQCSRHILASLQQHRLQNTIRDAGIEAQPQLNHPRPEPAFLPPLGALRFRPNPLTSTTEKGTESSIPLAVL